MPVRDALLELARAYPRQFERTPTDEAAATLRVYADHLADVPEDVLHGAVRALIRTEEWFPTVAKIRSQAAELVLRLPGETEALAQVDARIAGDQTPLHPAVRAAVDLVGGFYNVRTAEEPTVVRGQLRRAYREIRAGRLRDAQTGLLALPPGAPSAPAAVSCKG